jgi:hypothetical protein
MKRSKAPLHPATVDLTLSRVGDATHIGAAEEQTVVPRIPNAVEGDIRWLCEGSSVIDVLRVGR